MVLHARLVDPWRAAELASAFFAGQAECYRRFGAEDALVDRRWDRELGWLVCVLDEHGTLQAGARLCVRASTSPLPVEEPLGNHALLRWELERRSGQGIAEVGALWASPSTAGSGIGGAIIASSVAFAALIGVRNLVSLAHNYNRFTRRVGFEPDTRIGPQAYPDERYQSMVCWCDARDIPSADPVVQRAIFEMRRRAFLGEPVPLSMYPQADAPSSARPVGGGVSVMSSIEAKSRPLKYPKRRGLPRSLVPGVFVVETDVLPADADTLLARGPRLTGSSPSCDTAVALRDDAGELLALASVTRGDRSPLRASSSTAYLADLAWREGDEAMAPLVLYAAARRARIEGATQIAAHVCDPHRAVTGTLGLVALEGRDWPVQALDQRSRSLVPAAARLDVAIDRAWRAFAEVRDEALDPQWFIEEIEETIERWLEDIYARGFFRAIFEGTLTREQYVYAASNMHQFVRWTTRLLGLAVGSSHDRPLRDHYLGHLSGEVNHEIIIERDLAHLGVDVGYVVERMPPSPHTRQFMAVQESLIGFHHDPITFMASPLAAEGIASHLTPAFVDALERAIASWGVPEPRKAMMFFTSHVHTDGGEDGHWESTLAILRRHLTSETVAARFLATLRSSQSALTGAYDEYVEHVGGVAAFQAARSIELEASAAEE